jgi:hypothetical protein
MPALLTRFEKKRVGIPALHTRFGDPRFEKKPIRDF